MQIKYFDTAWNDLVHSPGWVAKLLQLALLNLIPIFGQIVVAGYLYGWSREIAWGVHEPMPRRIFANEDGKLYRRGFYIFVMMFVFALVLGIFVSIGTTMTALSLSSFTDRSGSVSGGVLMTLGSIISLIGWVASILMVFFVWVASMRISIYDRLSAGFQLGKIWKMIKYDAGGIARIFGMNLLLALIGGFALSVVFGILFAIFGVSVGAGLLGVAASATSEAAAEEAVRQYLLSGNLGGIVAGAMVLSLLSTYAALVLDVFVEALTARALGYWTMQFDVPHWRGQDDPMPFELAEQAGVPSGAPQYEQPPYQSQPQQQNLNQVPYQSQFQGQPAGQYQSQESPWAAGVAPILNVEPAASTPENDETQQGLLDNLYDQPMEVPSSFVFEQAQASAQEASDAVDAAFGDGGFSSDADVVDAVLEESGLPEGADPIDIAFENDDFAGDAGKVDSADADVSLIDQDGVADAVSENAEAIEASVNSEQ